MNLCGYEAHSRHEICANQAQHICAVYHERAVSQGEGGPGFCTLSRQMSYLSSVSRPSMSLRSAATMFSRLGALGLVAAMTFSPLTGAGPGLLAGVPTASRLGGPGALGFLGAPGGPGALLAFGVGSCAWSDAALVYVVAEEISELVAWGARGPGRVPAWLPELPGRLLGCCRCTHEMNLLDMLGKKANILCNTDIPPGDGN